MGAFALAAGVAVVDEHRVEAGFDDVVHGVVQHPVPETGCRDGARFGVSDLEDLVPTVAVDAGGQFSVQAAHFAFEVEAEPGPFAVVTPAPRQRSVGCPVQVLQADDLTV